MARICISLDELIHSLEDHCFFTHYYLDRETGEIIIQSENDPTERQEIVGEMANPFPEYDSSERYLPVEPMESRRGIEIMESFAGSMPDGEARHRLLGALSKQKPFRNFKDTLYDYPDLGERWWADHNDSMITIAVEWLRHIGIDFELIPSGKGVQ
ncbi:MAG TPA: UPF0158 family protein [Spirochaetota bacterium]|nr:UPF0158 family protein [Spirochaetota bacterium]